MNLRSARKLFARSPATHRPMARWLWNDHLDPDRLVAQLDRLLDMGLGGALIRPGKGLPPRTYLSDSWFEAVTAVVRRARKRHASIWIAEDFDDPWTQEIARGITAETRKFAAQMLRMRRVRGGSSEAVEADLADVPEMFRDGTPSNRIEDESPVSEFKIETVTGREFLRDRYDEPIATTRVDSPSVANALDRDEFLIFRSETWPDVLSVIHSAGTLRLLELTHELYYANLKRYFGNTIGVSMVLNAGMPAAGNAVPWDADLPHIFGETYGYSINENLPKLFFEVPGFERVRYDFWSLVADMFDEGLARPFERWCDERDAPGAMGLANLDGLQSRVTRGGSSIWPAAGLAYRVIMPHDYREEPIGFEQLHRQQLIDARDTVSCRRQLDRSGGIYLSKSRDLDMPMGASLTREFRGLAQGVEFFEDTVSVSSLRGSRKTDVRRIVSAEIPNEPLRTSPTDASARITWVSDIAIDSAEVLLLHPVESLKVQAMPQDRNRRRDQPTHDAIVRHFSAIAQALADAHIDFDFGDEQILARHGSVEGREFKVGRARYGVLVVPPSVNLRASTLALLQDFAMVGGLVIAVGTVPAMIDGRPSEPAKRFFAEYPERIMQGVDFGDYGALLERLVQLGARTVAALGEGGETRPAVYVRRGRWESAEVISAINGGWDDENVTMEWVPEVTGIIELWDPITGRTEPVATCEAGATARVPLELAGGAAKLLVVAPGDPTSAEIDSRPCVELGRIGPEWFGRRLRSNACVLTECRAANGAGDWSNVEAVRGTIASSIDAAKGPIPFSTEWRFVVDSGPVSRDGWSVAVEIDESGSLALNGRPISMEDAKPLFDPAILQIRLPALPSGEHVLTINRSFAEAGDLQPPWLLGPFKLLKNEAGELSIIATDESVPLGHWSEVGLPSYFGEVVYRAEVEGAHLEPGERATLEIEWVGHAADVRVNGKSAGVVFARPFECDLTEHWGPGTRTIDIVVCEAPDNALAGLRALDEFDTTHAGLIGKPEVVIYGRSGGRR